MVSLQSRDASFKQDIREFLMALFPGQNFSHVPEQDAMIPRIMTVGTEARNEEVGRLGTYHATLLTDRGEWLSSESPQFSEHLTPKNELERTLCRTPSAFTGKELPWGTLTGIRPTKLALNLLQRDKTAEEIRAEFRRGFFLSNTKSALCAGTTENELRAIRGLNFTTGYSPYIDIPLCPTICLCCSFPSYPAGESKVVPYLTALREELRLTAKMMAGRRLDAVYVGSDTPTSLMAEEPCSLLLFVCETFDFSVCRELTVEAGHPDSIIREGLLVLREAGVDRISTNPRTLKQATPDLIGRLHAVEQFTGSFALARELGFDNINTDLIMGLPNETKVDVRCTMEGICVLSPGGVTTHSLALKRVARPNTKHKNYRGARYGDANQMVELVASYCGEMGLLPCYLYRQKNMAGNPENVGRCRSGREGLYNILIMEELETAVGCGADTTTRVIRDEGQYNRLKNVKDPALCVGRLSELPAKEQRALAGGVSG